MTRARKPAPKHRKTPDPMARKVGARVRALRKTQGISFDAFAEETMPLGRGYISLFERGLVVPGIHTLAKIAAGLDDVTMADLVLGDSLREQVFEATRGLTDADLEHVLRLVERLHEERGKGTGAR